MSCPETASLVWGRENLSRSFCRTDLLRMVTADLRMRFLVLVRLTDACRRPHGYVSSSDVKLSKGFVPTRARNDYALLHGGV